MAVENRGNGALMMSLNYTTRSMRRRRNADQREYGLSHTDPITGEVVRTYGLATLSWTVS